MRKMEEERIVEWEIQVTTGRLLDNFKALNLAYHYIEKQVDCWVHPVLSLMKQLSETKEAQGKQVKMQKNNSTSDI